MPWSVPQPEQLSVDPMLQRRVITRRTTQQKCRWTIYKSLEAIPEERYQRIGHEKPQLPVIQPS